MVVLQIQMMEKKWFNMTPEQRSKALEDIAAKHKNQAMENTWTESEDWDSKFDEKKPSGDEVEIVPADQQPEHHNVFPQWLKDIITNNAPQTQYVDEHEVYKAIWPDGRMAKKSLNKMHKEVWASKTAYPKFFEDYHVCGRILVGADEVMLLEMNPTEIGHQNRVLEMTLGGDEDILKMLEDDGVNIKPYLNEPTRKPVKNLEAPVVKAEGEEKADEVQGTELDLK